MAKKRLVDLLEEAQSASAETEAAQVDSGPNQTLEEDTTLSEMNSHPANEQSSTEARTKRTGPTKAELETTVAELKEALEESQQKETHLLKQITELESDMQDLKRVIQSLHTEVEAAEGLKTELEEAKQVIRGLSKANLTTSEVISSTKAESSHSQVQLKKLPTHSIEPGSLPKMSSDQFGSLPKMSSDQSGSLPQMSSDAGAGMLSDADIGWVD